MSKIETVKVVNEDARGGFMIINADDFDADTHVEFEEEPTAKIPETPEDIDALDRDAVVALLKSHGVEKPKGKIDDLKDDLKKIMFVND